MTAVVFTARGYAICCSKFPLSTYPLLMQLQDSQGYGLNARGVCNRFPSRAMNVAFRLAVAPTPILVSNGYGGGVVNR
jgi:hypothetical protein